MILFFDVIGTVFDWHTSLTSVIHGINPEIDVEKFVWGCLHEEGVIKKKVEDSGEWLNRDELQQIAVTNYLDKTPNIKLDNKDKEKISDAWNNCLAWPDCQNGLNELRKKHITCTLSNSTISQLTKLCDKNHFNFNFILSAELFKAYKPNPKVYIDACKRLNSLPEFCIMVAAHNYDLEAAAKCGLKTAFIHRKFGNELPKDHKYDYVCNDLNELAIHVSSKVF